MKTFEVKTKIVFGENALEYIAGLKGKKVFIVTDPFMVKSGMIDRITTHLTSGDYQVRIYHTRPTVPAPSYL